MDEWLGPLMRMALPLLLVTLSEVVAERGGIVNLGIEGMMAAGALAAYLVAAGGGAESLPTALVVAMLTGALLGGLHAVFSVLRGADMIVTGTALHLLCTGATGLLFERFKRSEGVTTFSELAAPWPFVPYAFAALLVLAVHAFLASTGVGLRLRAAGENPEVLRAAGHSPRRSRALALVLAGVLAALGGATLTTVLTSQYVEGMTNGRGFLALSLVLFARWTPLGALVAAAFLGASFAGELALSARAVSEAHTPLRDLLIFVVRAFPYVATVAALSILPRSSLRAPAALGQPLSSRALR